MNMYRINQIVKSIDNDIFSKDGIIALDSIKNTITIITHQNRLIKIEVDFQKFTTSQEESEGENGIIGYSLLSVGQLTTGKDKKIKDVNILNEDLFLISLEDELRFYQQKTSKEIKRLAGVECYDCLNKEGITKLVVKKKREITYYEIINDQIKETKKIRNAQRIKRIKSLNENTILIYDETVMKYLLLTNHEMVELIASDNLNICDYVVELEAVILAGFRNHKHCLLIISTMGELLNETNLPDSKEPPLKIVIDYPVVFVLFSSGLKVYCLNSKDYSLKELQTIITKGISIKLAKIERFEPELDQLILCANNTDGLIIKSPLIFYNRDGVFTLEYNSILSQVFAPNNTKLNQKKCLDNLEDGKKALEDVVNVNNKNYLLMKEELREINSLLGLDMFGKDNFEFAMELFAHSNLEPQTVVNLFAEYNNHKTQKRITKNVQISLEQLVAIETSHSLYKEATKQLIKYLTKITKNNASKYYNGLIAKLLVAIGEYTQLKHFVCSLNGDYLTSVINELNNNTNGVVFKYFNGLVDSHAKCYCEAFATWQSVYQDKAQLIKPTLYEMSSLCSHADHHLAQRILSYLYALDEFELVIDTMTDNLKESVLVDLKYQDLINMQTTNNQYWLKVKLFLQKLVFELNLEEAVPALLNWYLKDVTLATGNKAITNQDYYSYLLKSNCTNELNAINLINYSSLLNINNQPIEQTLKQKQLDILLCCLYSKSNTNTYDDIIFNLLVLKQKYYHTIEHYITKNSFTNLYNNNNSTKQIEIKYLTYLFNSKKIQNNTKAISYLNRTIPVKSPVATILNIVPKNYHINNLNQYLTRYSNSVDSHYFNSSFVKFVLQRCSYCLKQTDDNTFIIENKATLHKKLYTLNKNK